MNYLKFLQLLIAAGDKLPQLIAIVQRIAAEVEAAVKLFSDLGLPTGGGFTLPLTAEEPTDLEPTSEELEAEAQVLALLAPDTGDTLAQRDGTRLRKLFELVKVVGPLLIQYGPLIAGLFPKK